MKDGGGRPVIGNNVTLGASVTIIGNVKIGNNVIIGAGSVVVHDVPNNTIVAGNPARVIRYIDMAKNPGGVKSALVIIAKNLQRNQVAA